MHLFNRILVDQKEKFMIIYIYSKK